MTELKPPGDRPSGEPSGRDRQTVVRLALGALLLLCLAVVAVLPRIVAIGEPELSRGPAGSDVRAAIQESQSLRDHAEALLQDYLRARAALELGNASVWGGPRWSEAADVVERGDAAFGARDFSEAGDHYARALSLLESVESSRDGVLANAIEQGQAALDTDDGAAAAEKFTLALAIDEDNADALQGLARAQVRAQVLIAMTAGRQAERGDNLHAARDAYAKAAALDRLYAAANDSLERVQGEMTERRFTTAIGDALAAIDAGRFDEATAQLGTAASLKPDDAIVRDAKQRLADRRRLAGIEMLYARAQQQVRAEDWAGAVATYTDALGRSAGVAFAAQGIERARERAALHAQLDHYLGHPERLSDSEPLDNASKLLAEAGRAPALEPKLANKLASLDKAVAAAAAPLRVVIRSDGLTDIVIYRVGKLGTFDEKQLELRPGRYTVTGSRKGYRDVRRELKLSPGTVTATLEIRCTEPI